ncbi:MAG: hypothetical protein OES32_07560 [Acidobacteriota bacterium]|nr:hypothetical protein [Acidobacteriota bacterium]
MKEGILWLRAGYWLAAIADFGVAGLVLVPERMGVAGYVYPMGLMSSVAFSWAVLLVMADRRPLERRWIVPPTILVVALLGVAALHAGWTGLIPTARAAATALFAAFLVGVLTVGYRRSALAA